MNINNKTKRTIKIEFQIYATETSIRPIGTGNCSIRPGKSVQLKASHKEIDIIEVI